MRKTKLFILTLIIFGTLFFLFWPEVWPENIQFEELLDLAKEKEVIIIFNSGGWGNTPLEEAKDFTPIILGIQETLKEWGYQTLVIPYVRTKDGLSGKITGMRDFLNSFQTSSEKLAEKVNFLVENLPDKKYIMAGLSNGGALVNKAMEKISNEAKDSVYGISAGMPFWLEPLEIDNILHLNNNGRDALSAGKIKSLISVLVRAPFKWILAKKNGENLSFFQALHAPGHDYSWSSPEVGPQIVIFLENKFR